ncbi:hypothetical protein IFR05_013981 [Cadophora sp. M221]|nr:hypothetical protein IFR05_013981 [Cadophora sp. M221]
MIHTLMRVAVAAILSTSVVSALNITEGEQFGFELQNTTHPDGTLKPQWVPSQALLDEQAARMETYYIIDPATNKTIINPVNDHSLAKRNDFNPYDGAECRMVFKHHYNIAQCCGGQHCEDCSTETTEFRILDNKNSDTNFAVFDMDPGSWEYYQLNGHRGWWGIANWGWDKWYAIDSAYGHIEGAPTDRDMKGGEYCWYAQGSAWWGYWGEAACTSYCSAFNW